jgi:cell division protein ZapA
MSDVTIEINGRAYQIACEDGQEDHLERLAEFLEKRLQDVASTVGQVGQERLLVMVGLLVADDLSDSLAEIDEARANPNPNPETARRLQDEASEKAEAKAAHTFELLADRIETIAETIEQA